MPQDPNDPFNRNIARPAWLDVGPTKKDDKALSTAVGCIFLLAIIATIVMLIAMCVGIYLALINWG